MVIKTRADSQDDDIHLGTGKFSLRLTEDQLRLIAAFLYITKLGHGGWNQEAYQIVSAIEDVSHDDFIEESFEYVQPFFSVTDDKDNIVETYSGNDIIIDF